MRVLVVDDDCVSRAVAEKTLTKSGMGVVAVDGVEEALQRLAEEPFDALVTDLMMPGVSGMEFIEGLRKTPKTARLPIVVCTAVADREHVVEAISLGIQDYVVKPIRGTMFVEKVRRAILAAEADVIPDERAALLRLQMSDDLDGYRELIAAFAAEMGDTVAELRGALGSDDAERVGILALRLEGAAGNLGAAQVCEVATELAHAAEAGDATRMAEQAGELEGLLAEVERYAALHAPEPETEAQPDAQPSPDAGAGTPSAEAAPAEEPAAAEPGDAQGDGEPTDDDGTGAGNRPG